MNFKAIVAIRAIPGIKAIMAITAVMAITAIMTVKTITDIIFIKAMITILSNTAIHVYVTAIMNNTAIKDLITYITTIMAIIVLTLIRRGGGQICPTDFQTLIPLEPKVGLTSNQAVNSSLSVVSRSKKKIDQFGP